MTTGITGQESPGVTVAADGRTFVQEGRPTFLLADTCWSAFGRVTDAEWGQYLRHRHRQVFNAVAVSLLPIAHDQSVSPGDPAPFLVRPDGSWDLARPDADWFARARRRCAAALAHGITPIVVVLWCTYVAGTWASRRRPELALDERQTNGVVDAMLGAIGDLPVILCVCGDDHLSDPSAVDRYVRVLERIHAARPERLTTLHTSPTHETPAQLLNHPALSFHTYQSGHGRDGHKVAHRLATRYRALPGRRPLLNLEPCYEGHASDHGTGRHTAAAVRRSSWTSVLGGAGAGLGYGAHGVWSWHREGDRFLNEAHAALPFPADVALQFPGAWDVGLIRRLVETCDLVDLTARDDLAIDGERLGVRVGLDETAGRLAIYFPESQPVTIDRDLSSWQVEGWDLTERRPEMPWVAVADGRTSIGQPDAPGDSLIVFARG